MDEMGAKVIGLAGVPHLETIKSYLDKGYTIVDLDNPLDGVRREEKIIPRVYCPILRRVAENCFHLFRNDGLSLVLADVGEGKCDGMRYLASYFELEGIPVIVERNSNMTGAGFPISVSDLSLREKMELIVDTVIKPPPSGIKLRKTKPVCGFWGVPPYDFDILDLFPENTHIYGWTRCMENKTPADLSLELSLDPDVPTVFFAHSFCQKTVLACNLAKRYQGLFVEVDERLTRSTTAKIEAFIKFNVR
jgi:hypothetical protein